MMKIFNSFESSISGRKMLIVIGVMALVIFVTRLPGGLLAREGAIINVDELGMTLSTLDRFLGVPSTSLAWPGATLQLFGTPLIGIDYLLNAHFPKNQDGFATYISNSYRNPWHSVVLLRFISIVISSIGLSSLLICFLRYTNSALNSLIGVAFIAMVPLVWLHSHMATGDALSLGFACLSIATLIYPQRNLSCSIILSGAMMGLALASKVTIVLVMPFVLGIMVSRSSQIIPDLIYFLSSAAVGFIFACPYIWTDPLRLTKAIIGNATRPGQPMGILASVLKLFKIVPPPHYVFVYGRPV